MLSYALIYGSTQDDPTKYSGKANGLRLFCEVLTVIFLMFFFFEEVNEAERLVTTSYSIAVVWEHTLIVVWTQNAARGSAEVN